MSATNDVQSTYRVTYRHIEIAAAAAMEDRGDGTFRLDIDAPPPVRTVVSIAEPGRTRAFVVVGVVEVPAEGTSRGCVIREVPSDRLPVTVGTEKLRDGTLGSGDQEPTAATATAEGDNADDGYGTHMAVPSPVISEDPSEPTDVGADVENEGGADDSGTNGETATEDGATTEAGSSRAKKRRGRQRK